MTAEQTIFSKAAIQYKVLISANVKVATLIAQEGKPLTDAKFVKKYVLNRQI